MEFELPYWLSSGGDGSAGINLCATKDEAYAASDTHNEEGEGFAENCSGTLKLKVHDGKLYFRTSTWNGKKHIIGWTEVPQ